MWGSFAVSTSLNTKVVQQIAFRNFGRRKLQPVVFDPLVPFGNGRCSGYVRPSRPADRRPAFLRSCLARFSRSARAGSLGNLSAKLKSTVTPCPSGIGPTLVDGKSLQTDLVRSLYRVSPPPRLENGRSVNRTAFRPCFALRASPSDDHPFATESRGPSYSVRQTCCAVVL